MGTARLFDKNISIDAYRNLKIKLLERDFKIDVTDNEKEHLNNLQSEIAIDNYCRKIISNHWED